MNNFKATVQYGDFKGTAAADRADNGDLNTFLQEKGLMQDNEFLLAAHLWVGESNGGKLGRSYVTGYLYNKADNNHDNVKAELDALGGPIPVRKVDVPVSAEEFISFFKRFSVMLTRPSLNLDGRDFDTGE